MPTHQLSADRTNSTVLKTLAIGGKLKDIYYQFLGFFGSFKCIKFVKFQIAEISKRATELKQEVKDYRINRLEKVEQYVIDLKRKAEELESIQEVVKKFLQESSTPTIITERGTRSEQLLEAHSLDTSAKFNCHEQALVKNGGDL